MAHLASTLRAKVAATLLTAASVAAVPSLAQGADTVQRSLDPSLSIQRHGTELNRDAHVQVFVQLSEPSVAELNAKSLQASGSFATSAAQKAQAERVSAQQAQMRSALEGLGAEILSSQRVGANGFRMNVAESDLPAVRSLAGVRTVGRVERHTLNNAESVPWIGAPAVWSASGRGEHVKIGVIDTGIDYLHADFGGAGNAADYAANNKNVIEPGSFPTAKVVGGWDFAGPTYNANVAGSVPQPDADPLDGNGHGTHVAGTAAGIGVPGSVGAGVAPGADLYALKVFGDAGGSTDVTSLAIEWAMDPNGDGDMSDHLDVINMSLGSPFGEPNDPSAISSNNAAAVGIIVATSAGNEGDVPYITGAPGVASSAISTAANSPGGRLYSRFTVNAPASAAGVYPSLEGAGPVTLAQTGPITGALVQSVPANGCAVNLTNAAAIAGNIALIQRGVCGFIDKYRAAQNAGARAIVVYNDGANATRIAPITMGGLDATVTIPGLMISSTVGFAIRNLPGLNATVDAAPNPAIDDQIATFSSRGPGHGGSTFKPDLSAPGVAIVSAGRGTGTGSANLQGTSMASPHVAGAAALLRQAHPTLNQAGIKALLQNSTVPSNPSYDTDLARQGVGALRVDRAVALTSYASPGGVSFGRVNPIGGAVKDVKVTVTDLSGKKRKYTITHEPNHTLPGAQVFCEDSLKLNANGRGQFNIRLKYIPSETWVAGIFDDAFVSQREIDGWCVVSDGKDTLRVGYLAVLDGASDVNVFADKLDNSVHLFNWGYSIGWVEGFTLAKRDGELQNGTYGSISAVGFRRADPNSPFYDGLDVLEFGLSTEKPWEHLSNLTFELAIDGNSDGTADWFMVGTDLSNLDPNAAPGQFVAAQFNAAGAGFLDWFVNTWDFNDRAMILPFTLQSGGGFLPNKFNYVLTVTARDGTQDVQHGSVDLSQEIIYDLNSFGVEPGKRTDVFLSGPKGKSLWLLQNNQVQTQEQVSQRVN